MNALALVSPVVSLVDGIPTTTSNAVADYFGKRHDDVLKAVRNLIAEVGEGRVRNFAETSIDVAQPNGGTRAVPAYRLTRDGFTLLAMGFTGKRALRFKLAYIDAFNAMEAELHKPVAIADTFRNGRWLAQVDDRGEMTFTPIPVDAHVFNFAQIDQHLARYGKCIIDQRAAHEADLVIDSLVCVAEGFAKNVRTLHGQLADALRRGE
jgi:Rha family phage regulatory protein